MSWLAVAIEPVTTLPCESILVLHTCVTLFSIQFTLNARPVTPSGVTSVTPSALTKSPRTSQPCHPERPHQVTPSGVEGWLVKPCLCDYAPCNSEMRGAE